MSREYHTRKINGSAVLYLKQRNVMNIKAFSVNCLMDKRSRLSHESSIFYLNFGGKIKFYIKKENLQKIIYNIYISKYTQF